MTAVEISEFVRNWAIVFGGALGLLLAAWRVVVANRQSRAATLQAEIARRTHITEVFQRAVAELRDEKLEIRLGAIYSLILAHREFSDVYGTIVVELLEAYLREHARNADYQTPPIDVLAITEFIRVARR